MPNTIHTTKLQEMALNEVELRDSMFAEMGAIANKLEELQIPYYFVGGAWVELACYSRGRAEPIREHDDIDIVLKNQGDIHKLQGVGFDLSPDKVKNSAGNSEDYSGTTEDGFNIGVFILPGEGESKFVTTVQVNGCEIKGELPEVSLLRKLSNIQHYREVGQEPREKDIADVEALKKVVNKTVVRDLLLSKVTNDVSEVRSRVITAVQNGHLDRLISAAATLPIPEDLRKELIGALKVYQTDISDTNLDNLLAAYRKYSLHKIKGEYGLG